MSPRVLLACAIAAAYVGCVAWLAWSLAQWQSWVGALVALLGVLGLGYVCLQSGWLDRGVEQPRGPIGNANRNGGTTELTKHADTRNVSLVESPDSAFD